MTLRQMVIIELLVLANGLALAVGVLLMVGPAATVFSHDLAPTQVVVPEISAAARTAAPAPTGVQVVMRLPTVSLVPTQPTPPTFTATPEITLTPSSTPTSAAEAMSATPDPTSTATQLPGEVILSVVGHKQSLPLSCESRSAVDWANYFGVGIDELQFFSRLPISDNPELGFVGDVNGHWGEIPPNAYGVHAGPVATLLRDYGLAATAYRDVSWDAAQAEIRAGRPLVVWVVGHVWARPHPVLYTAADGAQVQVAPFEHTVILAGFDSSQVYVVDGANLETRPIDVFLSSWSGLGNQAVMLTP